MTSTKEIITFQIGHYSNFVGTHWWNIQESSFSYDASQADTQPVNHDILFREGLNSRGEVTYTPRLICVDLKGSLKTLQQDGTLYNVSNSSNKVKWSGEVDVQSAPAETKNEFLLEMEKQQQGFSSESPEAQVKENDCPANDILSLLPKKFVLDDVVSVWSDFLRTNLNPRSVLLVEEYHHNNEIEQFDFFGCGIQVAKTESFKEDIQNRIRSLAEECDYLQGFQMLLDGYNGFAGITSSVLLHLEEEYGQKIRICYPLYQPSYKNRLPGEARSEETYRLLTSLLCLENLSSSSHLFSPLSLGSQGLFQAQQECLHFKHLSYKSNLQYHTGAILATALETVSLPTRLKQSPTHLRDLAQQMAYGNRTLVSSHLCLPFPLHQRELLSEFFSSCRQDNLIQPLTPLSHSQNALIQYMVFSGIPEHALSRNPSSPEKSLEETIAKYIGPLYPCAALFLKCVTPACKVVAPFPHIFSKNTGGNGLIQSLPRTDLIGVQSVPVIAAFKNSSACTSHTEDILQCAKKVNVAKFHRCLEMDIESDCIKEAIHNLEGFADNYKDLGFLIEG